MMIKVFTRLAVCGLLLFLVSTVQSQVVDIPLRTAQGCSFFHPGAMQVKSVSLTKMANHQCIDGRVSGAVFYGVGWELSAPEQEIKNFIGMRAGLMVNGQFDGLRLGVNQGGRVFLTNSANSEQLRLFERESPQYSLNALLAAIAELVPQTGSKNPATNISYLHTIARAWDGDPYGLMKEFTDPANQVMFQNLSWVGRTGAASTPVTGTLRDDPKTTGRGARGG